MSDTQEPQAQHPVASAAPLARAVAAITRPARSDAMAAAFIAAGARVELIPVTHLEPEVDVAMLEIKLAAIHASAGWLILPSPSAIGIFLGAARQIRNFSDILRIPVATIGPAGAELLGKAGFGRVFTPAEPNAESLARTLPVEAGGGVLIAGADTTRAELAGVLAGRGVSVARLSLYRTVSDPAQVTRLFRMLFAPPDPLRPIRFVVVTAPSAIDAIASRMTAATWHAAGWLAIGPTTMARLKESLPAGAHAAQAETPDAAALVRAAAGLMEARS